MSYNIILTNGTPLVTIADGTEDSSTTSLNLVGRNFAGFGTYINQNFVKLLENCSSSVAPSNPLVGQLWWDSTSKHLNVWQGTSWKVISSSMTGVNPPSDPVTGDFWWNTNLKQFSVYDAIVSQWVPIGPPNAGITSVTALIPNAVSDGTTIHNVGNVLVNNKLSGVFSTDSVAFNPATPMSGLTTINPGLNLVTEITVPTANIANLTVGNSATIASNLTVGNLSVIGAVNFHGQALFANISADLTPSANLSYNLGSISNWWNNIYGTSIHAQYADLAERFEADAEYVPGTVVEIGGTAEITAVGADLSEDVFGVISTNAAYLMNSGAGSNSTHPPVAVQGRVPVRVTGTVRKGDRLVSAGNGVARSGKRSEITAWNVIGRALENKTTPGLGVVEAVVKLNS